MKIKTKAKTVKTISIKLNQAEAMGLFSDVYDALNASANSLPNLTRFYDTLRAEVHSL